MNRRERLLFINQSDQSKLIENSFKFQMFIIQMSAPERRSAIQGSSGRFAGIQKWSHFIDDENFHLEMLSFYLICLCFIGLKRGRTLFIALCDITGCSVQSRKVESRKAGKGSEGRWRIGRPVENLKAGKGSESRWTIMECRYWHRDNGLMAHDEHTRSPTALLVVHRTVTIMA